MRCLGPYSLTSWDLSFLFHDQWSSQPVLRGTGEGAGCDVGGLAMTRDEDASVGVAAGEGVVMVMVEDPDASLILK